MPLVIRRLGAEETLLENIIQFYVGFVLLKIQTTANYKSSSK